MVCDRVTVGYPLGHGVTDPFAFVINGKHWTEGGMVFVEGTIASWRLRGGYGESPLHLAVFQ